MNLTEPACGLPGTLYFDLTPAAGGEPYRIFVFKPKAEPPVEGWPLLVLTDGNATFPFAFASLVTQAPFPSGTNVGWGVVAAIGYPSDEPYDAFRRAWDLGPPPIKSYPPYFEGGPAVRIGGTGELLDFIEMQLLPHLAGMVRLDASRPVLNENTRVMSLSNARTCTSNINFMCSSNESGMPAAALHREFRDGQLVEETIFRYKGQS